MSTEHYAEFNQQTIPRLKKQGFTAVQLVLLDSANPYQATVELKPLKNREPDLDTISLQSEEIHDFMDGLSTMTRYVISREYLADDG